MRKWTNWLREDFGSRPCAWLRLDFVPPSPFLLVRDPQSQVSRILVEPHLIDAEFRKAWMPFFCRSGHLVATVRQSSKREEVYAALQYAASFHMSGRLMRRYCEELKPKPKEKWIFVEKKSEETKHRTEWCANSSKYRCMRCGRGSKYMKM